MSTEEGTGTGGGYIVYSCHCLNIRIHLSTKYSLDNLDQSKDELKTEVPVSGWEFDLGMGGIVIEFSSLSQSTSLKQGWKATSCLNCNCGNVYSVATEHNTNTTDRVIIHENAICGQAIENIKHDTNYSQIFNIKLNDMENLIPMPASVEDDDNNKLVSAHQQIQEILDQNIEKIRIESKLRIEEFKRQEEKRTQELIQHAKLENNQLWSKIVQVTKELEEKKTHVRIASASAAAETEEKEEEEKEKQSEERQTIRKLGFALDEDAISSSLRNKNLDSYQLKLQKEQELLEQQQQDEDEEEDMFNLDEEFSDTEENLEEEIVEKDTKQKEDEEEEKGTTKKDDALLSASFKKSVSEIDQKFSWIKKKRNTSKYLAKDFDIKTDLSKRDAANTTSEEEPAVSMFATSVPITIHYPAADDEEEKQDQTDETEQENNKEPKKKSRRDILAASFANYNYSYSDRLLSDQLPDLTPIGTMSPAQNRRKSLLAAATATSSSSYIARPRPQLESLVGKSLDTRGLMMKKKLAEEDEEEEDDDEYDSNMPPHVWALMNSYKDEFQLAITASSMKKYDE